MGGEDIKCECVWVVFFSFFRVTCMQSRPELVGRNSGSNVSITAPLQRVHWVRCSVVQKSWWIHKRSLWAAASFFH